MWRKKLGILALGTALTACSGTAGSRQPLAPPVDSTAPPLDAHLDELWALQMRTFPGWATYEGIREYDALLEDVSEEAEDAYLLAVEAIAARVAAVEPEALSAVDRDTRDMVIARAETLRAGKACRSSWWDVNGLGGPQVDYPMLPVFFPIRNAADATNLEARYRATARQIEQVVANLERGVQAGYAPTRTNLERAITQLDEVLSTPIDADPMLKLNLAQPDVAVPTDGLRDAVETVVRPALARYRQTLVDVVRPAARPDVGIVDLPTGAACYAARVEQHLGPGYDAAELHERGLAELARAHAGMTAVGKALGLEDTSPAGVIAHFRGNAAYRASTAEQLLSMNAAVVERARQAMPRAFARLPQTPVEMRPIEAHRAKAAPAAYYYSAPDDGSRPAYYYVNVADPQTRPLFNLEALAFHEAIPGHHQQIALAQELPQMHIWRRNAGQTAFVEGWALYAEILADELGLYSDAVTKFGMHNYQAWRAARLVIDTGLHARGWTRQQAIDFLRESTALPENEIANEIDRYIAWPGQALAYMVGRLKIQQLRRAAQRAHGDHFSLRAFHDAVNANGAVPLQILDRNITTWSATVSSETASLPQISDIWSFDDPAASRARFEELLTSPTTERYPTYREQLRTQIARTHSLSGEFDQAHAVLDDLQRSLSGAEPVVRVRYLLERGRTYNSAKDPATARPLFVEAFETAQLGGLDALAIDAAHMIAIVESDAESIAWNERALALAEASDDPAARRWLASLYNNLGWTHHDGGNPARALELFEKALELRIGQGNAETIRIARWSVGRTLRTLGRHDDAFALQTALAAECEAAGKPDGFVFEELGELHLLRGEADLARESFARAVPLLEAIPWVEADRLDRLRDLSKPR